MYSKETELQIRCVTFLTYRYSHLVWNHSPNEGKRSDRQGAVLKRMGMQPGYPDLDIIHGARTLHVEFKTKTGRQSPAQKLMQSRLEEQGRKYVVVRTYEDFVAFCHQEFGEERDTDAEQLRRILGM